MPLRAKLCFARMGVSAGGRAPGSAPQTHPPWEMQFPSSLHYQTEFGNEGRMNPAINENVRNTCAAVAGACFVGITQLATVDTLSCSYRIAWGCYAVTLPIFAGVAGVSTFRKIPEHGRAAHILDHVIGYAVIVFLIGTAFLIGHFGWYFGAAFAVVTSLLWLAAHLLGKSKGLSNFTRRFGA